MAPSNTQSTSQCQPEGSGADREMPRPGGERLVCCRMSSTMVAWPLISAPYRALMPSLSSSSGGVAVDILRVRVGRVLQQDDHDGGVGVDARASLQQLPHDVQIAGGRSSHERGASDAGSQVDARASIQQHLQHLQLFARHGDVHQAEGLHDARLTAVRRLGVFWPLEAFSWRRTPHCVDRPSPVQPLDHLLQLASPSRL
eukprot:scaffold14647_cov60-Phaeocystis_antarctica.AAC.4